MWVKKITFVSELSRKKNFMNLTKCIIPAAVNHTEMNIDTSWARRIELDVFNILRYCRISGTVISRSARRNLRPKTSSFLSHDNYQNYQLIQPRLYL